jgi:hypothetical protein
MVLQMLCCLGLASVASAECMDPSMYSQLNRTAHTKLAFLESKLARWKLPLDNADNAQQMYDFQAFTHSLLHAAVRCNETSWLARLADLMVGFIGYVQPYSTTTFDPNGTTITDSAHTWVDSDGKQLGSLYVAQFVAETAVLIHHGATLTPAQRRGVGTNLTVLVEELAPVIFRDQVLRLIMGDAIWSNHGYGCDGGESLVFGTDMTVGLWLRTTDMRADRIAVVKEGTQWQLGVSDGHLSARFVTDATPPFDVVGTTPASFVAHGNWTYVAASFRAGTGASLFVDGVLVEGPLAINGTSLSQEGTGRVQLGGYSYLPEGSCCFLNGTLDEVRTWPTALSASDVLREYESSALGVRSTGAVPNNEWLLDRSGANIRGAQVLSHVPGPNSAQWCDDGVVGTALAFDGVSQFAATPKFTPSMDHATFIRMKLVRDARNSAVEGESFCNAVLDKDLWVIAACSDMLAALHANSSLFPITGDELARSRQYLADALALVQSRLTPTELRDAAGYPVEGVDFDRGMWVGETNDNGYAGYEGAAFPVPANKSTVSTISWDVEHADRFVHVFDSLFRNAPLNLTQQAVSSSFPTRLDMARLANQYLYCVFNGNLRRPLFRNYWGGVNGWYRVGYHHDGFGYQPYDLSFVGFDNGFNFWAEFSEGVGKLRDGLKAFFLANDTQSRAFRGEHYGTYWWNYTRTNRSGDGSGAGIQPDNLDDNWHVLYFYPQFAEWPGPSDDTLSN